MTDRVMLEAKLDSALQRVKAARADGQKAENQAFDLMIQIGTLAEVERDAAINRAQAAEQRAEALEREVAQLRDDRKALASMWLMTLPPGPLATVLPADPESARLLGGGLLDVTGDDLDTAGLIVYMRDLLARMLAEAQPAGEVSDG